MSVRTRMIRRMRKEIMRKGRIIRIEVLKENDGILWPKKEWGCSVECEVNGYRITAPDRNWYEAWKGALFCARSAEEMEAYL